MKRALLVCLTLLSSPAWADCPAAPITSTDDMVVSFLAANGTQAAPSTLFASSVKEGMLVYDDTNNALKVCNGTTWQTLAVGGASVTAAGTVTGAVQFRGATGNLEADDTNFVWDDTGNRLGIGTASPETGLHVANGGVLTLDGGLGAGKRGIIKHAVDELNTASDSIYITPGAINRRLFFGESGKTFYALNFKYVTTLENVPKFYVGQNPILLGDMQSYAIFRANNVPTGVTGMVFAASAPPVGSDDVDFWWLTKDGYYASDPNSYAKRMVLTRSGKLGIGTATPNASALLDVTSTSKGFLPPRMTTAQVTAVATPADGLIVYDTDTDTIKLRANGAWADLAFGAGGGGTTAAAGNAGEVQFNDGAGALTADSNLFWDNTNKRLGIGGTPTNPLTVQSATITPLFISRNESDNNSRWVASLVRIRTDATAPLAGFGGVLSFGLEAFTDGTVRYPASIKWGWEVDQTNDTTDRDSYLAFTTTADDVSAGTGGVEQMRITSLGNVGIGTSAPDAKLHVAGGVKIGDDSAACPGAGNVKLGTLRFNSGNFEVCQTGGWASASGGASGVGADGYVQVSDGAGGLTTSGATAGEQLFWDNTNKRLGIGTASPTVPLEITASYAAIKLNADTDTQAAVILNSAGDQDWRLINKANESNQFTIRDHTATADRLTINTSGNVGIGTTSPVAKLDVVGGVRIGDQTTCTNGTHNGTLRYNSGSLEICQASGWTTVGSGSGNNVSPTVSFNGGGTLTVTLANNIALYQSNTHSAWSNYGTLPSYLVGTRGTDTVNGTPDGSAVTLTVTGGPAVCYQLRNESGWSPVDTTGWSVKETVTAFGPGIDMIRERVFQPGSYTLDSYSAMYACSTAPVGGGTPGGSNTQVQFNDGGSFNGDASLVWDNTNKRLGIGTIAPAAALSIVDENNAGLRYEQYNDGDGTNYRNYRARGSIAAPTAVQTDDRLASFLAGGYGDTQFSGPNGGFNIWAAETFTDTAAGTYLTLSTSDTGTNLAGGGTERMRITADGNVGIGTTAPQSMLQVAGGVQIGDDTAICVAAKYGTVRYNAGTLGICLSTGWQSISTGAGGSTFTDAGTDSYTTDDIAIGQNSAPDTSALLELESTTKGFLPPRMTTVQRDALSSPATGLMIFDTTAAQYQFWNGTAWTGLGGAGVPTGTIAAFAATTCPSGWNEYTAARGRFLRGVDNGAALDPDGTRAPGSAQADALQNITGTISGGQENLNGSGVFQGQGAVAGNRPGNGTATKETLTFDASLVARTSTETRPVNIAVLFCQYTGSGGGGGATTLVALSDVNITSPSNGQVLAFNSVSGKWENSNASGGTPAGSVAGAVQFRGSSAVFTADDSNFVWDDTNKRLGIGTTASSKLSIQVAGDDGISMFRNGWGTTSGLYMNAGSGALGSRDGLNIIGPSSRDIAFGIWGNDTADRIGFYVDPDNTGGPDTLALGVFNNGNVGIGTASPGAKLDVVTATGPNTEQLRVRSASTAAVWMAPHVGASNWNGLSQAGDQGIYFQGSGGQGTGNLVIAPWAAATSGLRITSSGNVGIGTASPIARLHTVGPTLGTALNDFTLLGAFQYSDTNASKLDILGIREAAGGDWTTAGMRIQAVTDVTEQAYIQFNGNGNTYGLSFGVGGSGSGYHTATEAMRISSVGNVGIGTTSPAKPLHVVGNAPLQMTSPDLTKNWTVGPEASGNFHVYNASNTGVYMVYGGTSWTAFSDVRLKKNIQDYSVLDRLGPYRAISFDWKNSGKHEVGVIAQELEHVFPEIVHKGSHESAGEPEMGSDDAWGVDYDRLGALSMQGVKELYGKFILLKAANDNLATENAALHDALDDLRGRVEKLEYGK